MAVVTTLSIIIVAMITSTDACPELCRCNERDHTVLCFDPSLNTFPQGVPADTRVLAIKGTYSEPSQLHALGGSDLEALTSLKVLIISHTLLDSVGEQALQGLVNLQSLDLSFNRLTSLPANVLNDLKNLSELHLTGNQHLTLPIGIFQGARYLSNLHLGEIALTNLDLDLLQVLDQLKYLDLSNNQLTSLPVGIADDGFLPSLSELDLSMNRLTYLDNATMPLFKRLTTIMLGDNPWQCTCDMQWLQHFRQHIFGDSAVVCMGPELVAFQHLALLKPDQLLCIPPQIVRCDEVEPQFTGGTIQIRCNVSGLPFPFISWKTPDGRTTIGSSRQGLAPQLDLDPPRLTVTLMASQATNGTLTLTAQNVLGLVTQKMNILVKDPPITTSPPPTTTSPPPTTTLEHDDTSKKDDVTNPTSGPHSHSEEAVESAGAEGKGGGTADLMVYAAVGCSGLALLMSAIAIGVACRKINKESEQVKPFRDEERASNGNGNGNGRNPYKNTSAVDDDGYGRRHDDDLDSHYVHGGSLSPSKLRLNDMPPRQPSPIAWETNM